MFHILSKLIRLNIL